MHNYKALIFDIGNVILEIDYTIPLQEFQKLAKVDYTEIMAYNRQHRIFDLFETGKISEAEFHEHLKGLLKPGVTDQEIIRAWNSILVAFPPEKFELLTRLKQDNRVLALSNINITHVNEMNRVSRESLGSKEFADFFHKAYYSHEVGYRKPDTAFYKHVLELENLKPEEAFFVDDLPENVEAAKSIGMQAHRLDDPKKLKDLLEELHIL
ncbi:MAG: HAD family phosphatase [Chitinophagales bacterium]